MYQLCLPDGTFRLFPTRAQLYAAIKELQEAYAGYLK